MRLHKAKRENVASLRLDGELLYSVVVAFVHASCYNLSSGDKFIYKPLAS